MADGKRTASSHGKLRTAPVWPRLRGGGARTDKAKRCQEHIMNLLLHLDELVLFGFNQDEPGNDAAVFLQTALACDWETLHALLGRLSTDERVLLNLLVIERLSRAQTAVRLGINAVALRSRLWRIAGRLMRGGLTL